jgi:quercetin dioxygenase-like cupin family protein
MKRLTLFVALAALFYFGDYSFAQQSLEQKGVTSAVKLTGENFGFLTDLNGKYKLVATQKTFAPGAYEGEHNHVGPGIRYVVSGEITLLEQGKARTYKAGDYYFETGAVTHSASNKGNTPAVIISFEILPANLKGGSAVPPRSK